MGQILHGSAKTTRAVRALIQRSSGWQGYAQHDPKSVRFERGVKPGTWDQNQDGL